MRFKIGHTDIMTRRELKGDTSIPRPVESDAVFASVANIQYGALVQYSDGVTDLYVYASIKEFYQHIEQFYSGTKDCEVIWRSH